MLPFEAARDYRLEGRYDLALACVAETGEGPALLERARALVHLGRARDAVEAAHEALGAATAPASEAHQVLADALLASGELALARTHAEQALEPVREQVSTEAAWAWNTLAGVVQVAGDAPAALAHATRAVALLEQLQASAQDRALALQTLAEAQHRAGRYSLAHATWRQVLQLRREALDPDHPEIGAALDGLGLCLRRLGLFAESIESHQQALELHRQRLGPWHPAVATSLHGLAQAQRRNGDFLGARDNLATALCVSERSQGPDHMDTWVSRFELGRLELDCGQVEEGLQLMERAHRVLRERLGPQHPTVRAMADWL